MRAAARIICDVSSRKKAPSRSASKTRAATRRDKKSTVAPPPPTESVRWGRMHQKTREWTRRARRSEALKIDGVVRLDDYEAAEYLGLPIRRFRRLVEQGVLRFWPGTRLFDANELQDYMLRQAKTPEERRETVLRRVRWEAHDLEKYPLNFRTAIMEDFAATWEQLAEAFDHQNLSYEASAVRAIIRQARQRLRDLSTTN